MAVSAVVWITGLAGSGKSTLARALAKKLRESHPNIIELDGDELREALGEGAYDRDSRMAIAKRRARLAGLLSKQGFVVITTAIAMFEEVYRHNRAVIPNYLEVYVRCDMEELHRRDQKGLYTQALEGKISDVVGVDIAFDEPKEADLVIENSAPEDIEKKRDFIIELLQKRGIA